MKPYYEQDGITIYHGDCREVLPQLEAVDHVITDPPYSEYVHSMIAKARRPGRGLDSATHSGGLTPMDFGHITESMRRDFAEKISVRRWLAVFCDVESVSDWRASLKAFRYVRTGCWIKGDCTPQFSGDRPAPGFETIVLCHGPERVKWHGGGRAAVWEHNIVIDRRHDSLNQRHHPAQKPLPLMRELVRLFTDEGELILDPFMGSGTTLRAAKDLGRRAIGIEIEEKYCEIAARRMSQGVLFRGLQK